MITTSAKGLPLLLGEKTILQIPGLSHDESDDKQFFRSLDNKVVLTYVKGRQESGSVMKIEISKDTRQGCTRLSSSSSSSGSSSSRPLTTNAVKQTNI
ncbi:hypothetical protein F2Q69_00049267 [Brassica cretica]|uniref:Uncharacterized protein n=1 Tax=Brassica cretica TaxID=69181 RepID=A0A8S9PSD8_BRACR|nr:hypothetical protein F2Q69_00049267 [Brassica cretica]